MTDRTKQAHAVPLLTDILLRVYVAGAVLVFSATACAQFQAAPTRFSLLLIALIEAITAGFIVCSRRAQRCDWRPLSLLASYVAMFYFLALDLTPAKGLVSESVGVGLQVAGLFFQLYAKLSLGRSFGVLPATRRLITVGAYRWLRHPIYAGYLIAHIGFLLSNFLLQNLVVLLVLYLAQIVRIHREEEILNDFPGYSEYCKIVRYRLLPGIY